MFFKKNSLLVVTIVAMFFSCGGHKLPVAETPIFPERKAYVILRSEGDIQNIQNVKDVIASDFLENNVATNFSTYKARQAWNQNSIFKTAYDGKYDYIILIDQVAKFTIDGTTQVGGKYQLRSYYVKALSPDWLDLGQSTCNILVKPSIQKFSRVIVRSIVGNSASFKDHDFEYDDETAVASLDDEIETTLPTKHLKEEIERLKKELESEKQRTLLAEKEKQRIKNQLKLQQEAEKQNAEIERLKAENALQEKRKREKEIAKVYAAKREEVIKREAEEALKNPPIAESVIEEPTREDKLKQRQEAKRRISKQREEKRRQEEEAAFKRAEERKALAKRKRLEQEQKRAAVKAEREAKRRLAEQKKRDADLLREKEKTAKIALQKAKNNEEKRKAEILEQQRKEEKRLAVQHQKEQQLRKEREAAFKLVAEQETEKKLVESKRLEEKLETEAQEAEKIQQRIAEQERIVQQKTEESRKAKALAEAKKLENIRRAKELEKQRQATAKSVEATSRKSNRVKKQKPKADVVIKTASKKVNAFILIQGKEANMKQLKDLKDHLEFDLMFARAKSKIEILDDNETITNIASRSNEDANTLISIQQKAYSGDGKYVYLVTVVDKKNNVELLNKTTQPYNLSVKTDLKTFSKEVTQSISN